MAVEKNKLLTSGICHIGPVREENQDSICLTENINHNGAALFAVADGMGGYSNGKMASTMAIDSLCEVISQNNSSPSNRLVRGIETANDRIFKATQQMGYSRMGTTITAIYMDGCDLTVAHVGDSRLYLVRDGKAHCLTRDHTIVGDLVRMKVLTPDKVRTHSQRSILTRGVGLAPFVHPDISKHHIEVGDRLILCSDGLWSVIEDEELPIICTEYSEMSTMVNQLLFMAIERGTDDNISAIGIHIQEISSDTGNSTLRHWNRIWPF